MSRFLWWVGVGWQISTLLFVVPCFGFALLSYAQGKLLKKERAYIDPRYKTRSFAESKLVEIMEETWTFDPTERIRYVLFLEGAV